MPPVISVRDLTKTYKVGDHSVHALRSISLDVDAGEFLIENCRLARAKLGVRHRPHGKLTDRKQPIQRLKPVRHAVRADHRRGVFWVSAHLPALSSGSPVRLAHRAREQRRRAHELRFHRIHEGR